MSTGLRSWNYRRSGRQEADPLFSNQLDWVWRMLPQGPKFMNGLVTARSFLRSDLLFVLAPRANFQTAANPTELFGRIWRRVGVADDTAQYRTNLFAFQS